MKFVSPFVATIILVIITISIGIGVYMYLSSVTKTTTTTEEVINCLGGDFKIINFNYPKYEFKYSREIIIDNTRNSNNLNDYQILVTIDTSYLISNGYLKSDCSDIRFLDSDKNTLLNYWIEGLCNSQNTKIWVKVNIPANSKKIIYFVSGNENANSLSNKDSVFSLFDFYPNYPDWSDNRTYVCGNQGMMGGFNNFGVGAYTQKTISLDPGTYNISFIFIKGDTWDGEYGRLFLNNNLVWEKQYFGSQGSQICGRPYPWWDNELFDFINVTFTHNGGSLTIKFDSTLDQDANDEWWGVDRIMIRKYTYPEPTISLGNELGSIIIKQNTYSFNLYFIGNPQSSLGSKYIAYVTFKNDTIIKKDIDISPCNLGSECISSPTIKIETDSEIKKVEICSKACSYVCSKYIVS